MTPDLERYFHFPSALARQGEATAIGVLRFYGRAEWHEGGPVRDAYFELLLPREQTHVGADIDLGVLVKIDRAADVGGKPLP